MAISSNFMCEAGEINIEFGALGTISTFETISLSPIEYRNDVANEAETTLDAINQLIGQVDLTACNTLSDGTTISSYIDASPSTEFAFSITLSRGGTDYGFYFTMIPFKYKVDAIANTITISAQGSTGYGSAGSVSTTTISADASGADTVELATPSDVITALLEFLGGVDTILDDPIYGVDAFPSTNGASSLGIYVASGFTIDILTKAAKSAGAIFGSGFNTSWFVSRSSTNNSVSISTQDDIIGKPEKINAEPDLESVEVTFANTGFDSLASTGGKEFNVTDSDTVSATDNIALTVSTTENNICVVEYQTVNTNKPNIKSGPDLLDNDTLPALLTNAILNYTLSLRGNNTGLTTVAVEQVNVKVNDVLTVKPWQVFTIEDDTGLLSDFTSKTFRPSILKYDLINNHIDIEGYRIA